MHACVCMCVCVCALQAEADSMEALEKYRGRCEPTFLFFGVCVRVYVLVHLAL